ncbi:LuxR C-terminal-related transcriptional regulator [Escherichia coli]|nr:LuxR C-terminal-related transcriptional regulator [Escherichia coli]MDY9212746.1 LuxR C-terminal-related transcriptional regulator [Escherichia coli]MDY9267314.1 LuxR C-terminal-related transcriptional regulator [Escherichia coli]MDY9322078.1 LuxR C-terminal-related transcriptional regulator [Escherichia coli]MDY9327416.1 LuxR C-terminal-related transcriptional regulator [Escherichia coli]
MSERKNIWIYSDNVYFIKGVKSLTEEIVPKGKYAIHLYSEKQILDITCTNNRFDDGMVFSDTKNPLFHLYLNLFCNGNLISRNASIEYVRWMLILKRDRRNIRYINSSSQQNLSEREREIIVCMKIKMTDSEIARKFNLSKKTVSAHRRNILSKLAIRNRNELYKNLFALKNKVEY